MAGGMKMSAYAAAYSHIICADRLMAGVGAIALLRHPAIAAIDADKLGHAAVRLREAVEHLATPSLRTEAMRPIGLAGHHPVPRGAFTRISASDKPLEG